MTPDIFIAGLAGVVLLVVWLWALQRVRAVRNRAIPDEVKERSHEVKNEVMKIRAGLRQISKSPDPVRALVDAMTGPVHDRHH